MRNNNAFTVIELLVVIAIMGLLSSIIFVGVEEAKKAAELAKRKQFSQSIKNAIGYSIKGEWSFDSNYQFQDTSGYDNSISAINMDVVQSGVEKKGLERSPLKIWHDLLATQEKDISGLGFTFEAFFYHSFNHSPRVWRFIMINPNVFEVGYESLSTPEKLWVNVETVNGSCVWEMEKEFLELFEMNRWNHIAVTYSHKGIIKVYINTEEMVPDNFSCPGGKLEPLLEEFMRNEFFYVWETNYFKVDQIRIYDDCFNCN